MILFHGTIEEHIKDIKKKGLMAVTTDQWILEVTGKKVACFSKRPVSGEGGNPLFFARNKGQNGYIVVIDIPHHVLVKEKLIAILDNKTLDEYVQMHFFLRHEFREIGYPLFLAMQKHRTTDSLFKKMDSKVSKRPAKESDTLIFHPHDQREYYKELRKSEDRFVAQLLDLEISDELWDFIQYLGGWEPLWKFLGKHFEKIPLETWKTFQEKTVHLPHKEFWKTFYQSFPLSIDEPRYKNWQNWFSHLWLMERRITDTEEESNERGSNLWLIGHKLSEIGKNCQILAGNMEPQYVLGTIQITTPSKILPEFLYQTKSGIVQAIWDRVDTMLKNRR